MKVLVAGDTHGSLAHWKKFLFPAAKKHEVELIIQVGDFGIWPGQGGQVYLDTLDRLTPVPIWFVRGNHEDSAQIQTISTLNTEEVRLSLRPNVAQVLDGSFISIDGANCIFVGGAVSIDREYRTAGRSWWPDETTTWASIERAIYGNDLAQIDFVFTHDVPEQVDIVSKLWFALGQGLKNDPDSAENRRKLGALFNKLQGRFRNAQWIHGHYHLRYTETVNHVRFTGLDCDFENAHGQPPDSWTIIEIGATPNVEASEGSDADAG